MKRKHQTLDVVRMFSTLTKEHWRECLQRAVASSNVEKLVAWRYGMQAGLAAANDRGVSSETINLWVLKRVRNLETAMKIILRKKHPNPLDTPSKTDKGNRMDYVHKFLEAKRKRDREFHDFLVRSSF